MSKHTPDDDVAFISALAELLNKHELTEISVKREYGEDDSLNVRVAKQANIVMTQSAAPMQAFAAAPAPVPVKPANGFNAKGKALLAGLVRFVWVLTLVMGISH